MHPLISRLAAAEIVADAPADKLLAETLERGVGRRTDGGALVVDTGVFTGRSPEDKFIVRDDSTRDRVWWKRNRPMEPAHFERLLADMTAAAAGRRLHVQQLSAGADPAHAFGVTVVTESAWHALFIQSLLRRDPAALLAPRQAVILHLPSFTADPERHGSRTSTAIALDVSRDIILIAGTAYAGEIKKSVFSLFNFHAPADDVLPMHCSANIGKDGDTALFFGLSGTGKTTLSTDPERQLIGDDEHGWTTTGVFNLEGGCYAKTAHLTPQSEPEIFAAATMPGAVLENVVLDAGGVPDFADLSRTENTRAAYPLAYLPNVVADGTGPVPRTVVFLTADAFGVMPPLGRLDPEQAVYHFLSGYTSKLAGTERGVTQPSATFSACFGAPFMPLHPTVYGGMLAERLRASGAKVWLLNTGWTGGGYGVGKRIPLRVTRALLNAALSGELDDAPLRADRNFNLSVPKSVPGVPDALLDPASGWADRAAYDAAADALRARFAANMALFQESAAAV